MARVIEQKCPKCLEVKTFTAGYNGQREHCDECDSAEHQVERDAYFTQLDSLTIEQRIRLLEELFYDYGRA